MNERDGIVPKYIKNPDVVLREEDQDGALLFNPDTNQIKVLNVTGLFIWKLCDGNRDLPAIVKALQESFEKVPKNEANKQVKEYLDEMKTAGFVGIPEDKV